MDIIKYHESGNQRKFLFFNEMHHFNTFWLTKHNNYSSVANNLFNPILSIAQKIIKINLQTLMLFFTLQEDFSTSSDTLHEQTFTTQKPK